MKPIKNSLKPLNKVSLPRPRVFSINARKNPLGTIPFTLQARVLSQNIQTSRPLRSKPLNNTPLNLPKVLKANPSKKSIHLGQIKNLMNFDQRIIREPRGKSCPNYLKGQGLSRQALVDRRESHLNTYFNQRKNRLKEITRQNLKIYVKINSQKSLYDSRRLNTSRSSLNNSRLSAKNSTSSLRASQSSLKTVTRKRQGSLVTPKIEIIERNVNKLQQKDMANYLKIFCNQVSISTKSVKKVPPKLICSSQKENQGKMTTLEQIVEQFGKKDKTSLRQKAEYMRYR